MTATRIAAVALTASLGLIGSGCAAVPEATGYSGENREAFLAACTRAGEDTRAVRDICECTYEQIEANLAYTEFEEMEESLQVDALASLPDTVAGFVADCFIRTVDL